MSKEHKIEEHLKSGKPLTCLDALRLFHTTELRHYIAILRKKGIKIYDEWIENLVTGERYKEYFITGGN